MKISIIGAGYVGSTIAYTLMFGGLVSNIVLVDKNQEKALGEVMDLKHGIPFVSPVNIINGDYKDCEGSDIVIITAGANQKVGETRMDLINKNVSIFNSIISELTKYVKDAILLVVTNPVDILTYVTYKLSNFPRHKVIGSGTLLDTARFKYLLSQELEIDTRNIHGYILGEHGDSEFAAWSTVSVAGSNIDLYCSKCKSQPMSQESKDKIFNEVKNSAYEIINRKGATYYAVALAVRRIVEAIVRDEKSILTVSSVLNGEYGISNVSLSLPTILDKNGLVSTFPVRLNDEETIKLLDSANTLKDVIKKIGL